MPGAQARTGFRRYEVMGGASPRPESTRHLAPTRSPAPPSPIALRTEAEVASSDRPRAWRWDRARSQLRASWRHFVLQEALAIAIVVALLLILTREFPRWCLWLFVVHIAYYAAMLVWRCGRQRPTYPKGGRGKAGRAAS